MRTAWPLLCVACALVAAPAWLGHAEPRRGVIYGRLSAPTPRMLRDAVVYVMDAPGHFEPKEIAVLDQKKLTFIPRVLPILKGTTVRFDNSDHLIHNVFTPDGQGYDLGSFGFGETRTHTFDTPGVYTQLCRMHPAMIAFVVVLPNPYFALTDEQGRFRIRGVPPGRYALRAWQEQGYSDPIDVTVDDVPELRVELALHR